MFVLYAPLAHCSEVIWAYFNYPPIIYFDEKQQAVKGMAVGIIEQAAAKTSIKFRLKHYPLARLTQAIKNGEPIVVSSPKWPSLAALGQFSTTPVFTVQTAILSNNILPKELSQMKGTVGIIRGYNYSGSLVALQKNNPLLATTLRSTHLSLLKSLQAKRIDYVLDYLDPALLVAYQINYPSVRYRVLHQLPVYFFVSKSVDDRLNLMAIMDQIIPTLRYPKSPWADSQGLLQDQ